MIEDFDIEESYNLNDNYDVKNRVSKVIEELVDMYNTDLLKFYSPKRVKTAGVRSRNKIRKIRQDLKEICNDMLKQTQDYESDYDF